MARKPPTSSRYRTTAVSSRTRLGHRLLTGRLRGFPTTDQKICSPPLFESALTAENRREVRGPGGQRRETSEEPVGQARLSEHPVINQQ